MLCTSICLSGEYRSACGSWPTTGQSDCACTLSRDKKTACRETRFTQILIRPDEHLVGDAMTVRCIVLACLLGELFEHKVRHDVIGLNGLGERRVIPEGVSERIEDDEAGVDAGAQISAVQVCGSAEERVPAAGDEESGWQAVQVRVNGGKHGIFRIGGANVIRVVHATVRGIKMA